jgi:hypothetical protein
MQPEADTRAHNVKGIQHRTQQSEKVLLSEMESITRWWGISMTKIVSSLEQNKNNIFYSENEKLRLS